MAKGKNGIVNLDELFGQGDAVLVKFGGKEYKMVRPLDLDPKQLQQFETLTRQMDKLQKMEANDDGDFSDSDVEFLEGVINDIILMVSPKMPVKSMPFMAKVYLLGVYKEQISEVDDEAKKEVAGEK